MSLSVLVRTRIEDIRAAAEVVKGRKVAPSIKQAMIVPGSGLVKQQAEKKVWIKSSWKLVLNGVSRVAQCV